MANRIVHPKIPTRSNTIPTPIGQELQIHEDPTTSQHFTLESRAILWNNKKQLMVALSCTKTRYRATCTCTFEVVWLWMLLEELGISHKKLTIIHVRWCGFLVYLKSLAFLGRRCILSSATIRAVKNLFFILSQRVAQVTFSGSI